jgi:hypothetical protein
MTDILETVLTVMENIEESVSKKGTGTVKKDIVIEQLRDILGEDEFDKYIDMISDFIDIIATVSKGTRKLHLNVKKYCRC